MKPSNGKRKRIRDPHRIKKLETRKKQISKRYIKGGRMI